MARQDGWIVEEIVGVIWNGTKTGVGDVEGGMIWIWIDGDGVLNWHGPGVVVGIEGAVSVVVWMSVWRPKKDAGPTVGWTEPEGLDPALLVEVERLVADVELAVMVKVKWAQEPFGWEVVGWLVAERVAVSESFLGWTA